MARIHVQKEEFSGGFNEFVKMGLSHNKYKSFYMSDDAPHIQAEDDYKTEKLQIDNCNQEWVIDAIGNLKALKKLSFNMGRINSDLMELLIVPILNNCSHQIKILQFSYYN